ncbi:MAG: inner membrane-spanning protein YciB [Steroidobacteraceae bacterium]
MQALLELAPLAAFAVAYYLDGLYVATAVLMVAMAALLVVDLVLARRIPPMHGLSAALVFVFGAATLALHNQRFIELKASVFSWLVSAAFLASFWIGKRTLVERLLTLLLAPALKTEIRAPAPLWRRMNWAWVVFYAALGWANLVVALRASERFWVNFNVFGITLATALFVAWQVAWLMRRMEPLAEASSTKAH